LSEKKDIEKATAEGFIKLYNAKMRTTYRIIDHSDSPDTLCVNSDGNKLNLEITMTEDRPGDIKALLGRSDHRNIEALKAHRAKVEAGKASSLELISCLQGNLISMLVRRIQAKLNNDYGKNTALVVRLPFNLCSRTTVAKACSVNHLQTALSDLRPTHEGRATSAPQIGPYEMLQRPLGPGPECPFEPPDRTVQ
jgi:hypothetical protein